MANVVAVRDFLSHRIIIITSTLLSLQGTDRLMSDDDTIGSNWWSQLNIISGLGLRSDDVIGDVAQVSTVLCPTTECKTIMHGHVL